MLCGDRTEMTEHEMCLFTSGFNHVSHIHVDNTGEDRPILAVNREVDLYCARASQ